LVGAARHHRRLPDDAGDLDGEGLHDTAARIPEGAVGGGDGASTATNAQGAHRGFARGRMALGDGKGAATLARWLPIAGEQYRIDGLALRTTQGDPFPFARYPTHCFASARAPRRRRASRCGRAGTAARGAAASWTGAGHAERAAHASIR